MQVEKVFKLNVCCQSEYYNCTTLMRINFTICGHHYKVGQTVNQLYLVTQYNQLNFIMQYGTYVPKLLYAWAVIKQINSNNITGGKQHAVIAGIFHSVGLERAIYLVLL